MLIIFIVMQHLTVLHRSLKLLFLISCVTTSLVQLLLLHRCLPLGAAAASPSHSLSMVLKDQPRGSTQGFSSCYPHMDTNVPTDHKVCLALLRLPCHPRSRSSTPASLQFTAPQRNGPLPVRTEENWCVVNG